MTSDQYFVSKGKHTDPRDGRCAMEWTSYLAGEPHTDKPKCVSPVVTRYCIAFNDRLPDAERQQLRPYLARTIGTRVDGLDGERRRLCTEWLLHYALPLRLDQAGKREAAARLRALPGGLAVEQVREALYYARSEALDARQKAVDRLAERIRGELAKRGYAAAVADAVADAAADAVADAVADAAAAVADAAVAAVAVADAAVAADAVAVAVVADAVAVAADAVAVVAAVAAAAFSSRWFTIRDAVHSAVYAKSQQRVRELNAELIPAGFELLDRMLPTEPVQLPVAEDAEAICALEA